MCNRLLEFRPSAPIEQRTSTCALSAFNLGSIGGSHLTDSPSIPIDSFTEGEENRKCPHTHICVHVYRSKGCECILCDCIGHECAAPLRVEWVDQMNLPLSDASITPIRSRHQHIGYIVQHHARRRIHSRIIHN